MKIEEDTLGMIVLGKLCSSGRAAGKRRRLTWFFNQVKPYPRKGSSRVNSVDSWVAEASRLGSRFRRGM